MSTITHATAETFDDLVLRSKTPVLVDFWAEWCTPCKMMEPVLDQLAGELSGKLTIVKVNIEEPGNRELAISHQIRSIPNMKIFKKGGNRRRNHRFPYPGANSTRT